MHFSKLSAVFLGLTSFATASPIAVADKALAAREQTPAERGLVWTPRSVQSRQSGNNRGGRDDRDGRDRGGDRNNDRNNNRNDRNNIIIAQPINIEVNQINIIQQVQLVQIVQNLIVIDGGDRFRDNVRRNHFRNRRQNRDVNIVVIVVTQIVDVRNRGNQNIRYLTRQVESNPEFGNQEYVVVSERSVLTAKAADIPTATASSVPAFATGGAAIGNTPAVKQWDERAAPQLSSDSLLLPEGIAAPRWDGFASQSEDPASILEDNSNAFVGFGGQ